MGEIKRFFGIALSWIVVMSVFLIPVCAAETENGEGRVFDNAGLFSEEEAAELEEEALRMREEFRAEFIILTTDNTQGRSARETADDFYFSRGYEKNFDEDGAVVLIDMDNREIYLGTYGIMIRVITDQRLENILDAAYSYAVQGNYAGAARTMLQECEAYVEKGIVAGQYNYDSETGKIEVYHSVRWYEALVAAVISLGIAGAVCAGVRRSYRLSGGKEKDSALAYQKDCPIQINPFSDALLHTALHHTVIPRNQNLGGRSSGGSSSRRSTTHSHSGHRAGGGGRRF